MTRSCRVYVDIYCGIDVTPDELAQRKLNSNKGVQFHKKGSIVYINCMFLSFIAVLPLIQTIHFLERTINQTAY